MNEIRNFDLIEINCAHIKKDTLVLEDIDQLEISSALVYNRYSTMYNDRVVVRSRSQIVKPDALFVVFLGIKWAHDIVKKNRS